MFIGVIMDKEIKENNKELVKYLDEYLYTEYNTSKNTRDSYKYNLINLAKYYKDRNIITLKKEDIQEFLRKSNYKAKTKAHYLTCFNNFYKYLVNNNIIKDNPCISIKMPKLEKKLPVYLTYEEVDNLLNISTSTAYDKRNKAMLEI